MQRWLDLILNAWYHLQSFATLLTLSSQDSCNEAHTPDHTAETGLTVTETPDAGVNEEADNRVDGLADLFEKLYHLNKKLEEQEDDIFR